MVRRSLATAILALIAALWTFPAHAEEEIDHQLISCNQAAPPRLPGSVACMRDVENARVRFLREGASAYLAAQALRVGLIDHDASGRLWLAAGDMSRESFQAFAADDTTKPEKKRVKKGSEGKSKGEPATDSDNDDDDDESCFGCLGDIFLGLVASDEPAAVAPTPTLEASIGLPYEAVVQPASPGAPDITVWDHAGGRASNASIVGTVNINAEVTVTERISIGTDSWVRVMALDPPYTAGWVLESDVRGKEPTPAESDIATPVTTSPTETQQEPSDVVHDAARIRWELVMDLGAPQFTEEQINDEYESRYSVGLFGRWFLQHAFHITAGASFLHAKGEPQYDYVIGSTTESPANSRLTIWNIRPGFGQLYPLFNSSVFFVWEVGPGLYYLEETADLTILENNVVTGTREEKLSGWKGGFQAKVEVGGLFNRVHFGAQVSYSYFDWQSNESKSLTFDFLEKDYVAHFEFGISLGVCFF